ncbi:TonB-dependent receptor [Lampropedia cohaerens]|uniref:TonB-dependent receptor n=1 Tax=Lampropedia cohaerens TaxID=1610491 RepID=A0A0U1Q2E4_9BURK|nr:TonB-dependent receptor [Lampropedia cohaerens]
MIGQTAPLPRADAPAAPAAVLPEVHVLGSTLDIPLEAATVPVEYLDSEALRQRSAATLGETLEGLPGVRNNNYGAGAGRPVIRGADGARVRILSDGSEVQDASTSSPDHAVGVEPALATDIEILRGPATLLYGGGITGGVVNVRDGRVPTAVPERGYESSIELRRDTGADEGSGLFSLTGGHGPFALHVEGLKRSAGEYRAGSGWSASRVPGSDNHTWYGSVGGSFIHERGYLGLAYSRLRSKYGLPGHSHEYEDCHLHGDALHCGGHGHGGHDHDHDHGDGEHIALVDMDTERWDLRGELRDPVPGVARARLRVGLTDYRHDEIDHGAIGTTFKNRAHDARLDLEHQRIAIGAGSLRGIIGVQHTRREFSATGSEAYVEPTDTRNRALFALEEYSVGNWRFELGGRYEWQSAQLNGTHRYGTVKHHMGSLSAGANWAFTPGYAVAVSLSRSQRAPTAEELFSDGIHLASNTWERGNPELRAERSHNLDVTLRKTAGATRFALSAFYNRIDNYIYASTVDRYEDFRLIDYRQRDATFKGLEARLDQQLGSQWQVGMFGDAVRARFSGGGNVPRVPSHRLGVDASWRLAGWRVGGEWYRSFAQNRIADYETRTGAYDMLNLHVQWQGALGAQQHYTLFARLNNALDKLAFNHSSFVKQASPLRGRTLQVGARLDF